MPELTALIDALAGRYRRALLTKAGLLSILGWGLLGLIAWRLSGMRVPPVWSLGLPGAAALLWGLGVGWWVRRRWVSRRGTPAYVDRVLGLEQRLLTAEEVAGTPQSSSALYPLLVEDTLRRCSGQGLRLPRAVDHTTALLVLSALLLLLWPSSRRLPPFAHVVETSSTPQPPPPPPQPAAGVPQPPERRPSPGAPPSPPSTAGPRDGAGPSATDQPAHARGGGVPPDSSNPCSPQPNPQALSQPQDPFRQDQQGKGEGAAEGQPSPRGDARAPQPAAGSPPQGGDSSQGSEVRDQKPQERDSGQEPAGSHQKGEAGRSQKKEANRRNGRDGNTAGDGQREGAGTGKPQTQSHASGQRAEREAANQQQADRAGAGDGGDRGNAQGNQDALRAEIQGLLKQVSGELQELQAQLASAKQDLSSPPGTTTDPNLFEGPMPVDPQAAATLPVQLTTDTAQTKDRRPGSGVGEPSGEVSEASPTVAPEEARLSNAPLEERPSARQPVPPEYRSVFDRLNRRDASDREGVPIQ